MTGSVTLENNENFASDAITFTGTGSQSFEYSLPSGGTYSVMITDNNSDQACTLPNDSEGIMSSDKTITVNCATNNRNYFFSFNIL